MRPRNQLPSSVKIPSPVSQQTSPTGRPKTGTLLLFIIGFGLAAFVILAWSQGRPSGHSSVISQDLVLQMAPQSVDVDVPVAQLKVTIEEGDRHPQLSQGDFPATDQFALTPTDELEVTSPQSQADRRPSAVPSLATNPTATIESSDAASGKTKARAQTEASVSGPASGSSRTLTVAERALAKAQAMMDRPEPPPPPPVEAVWHSKWQSENCPVGGRAGVFSSEDSEEILFRRLLSSPALNALGPRVLSKDPWIMVFDSFFNQSECDAIIRDCSFWTPDILVGGTSANNYRNSSSFNCNDGPHRPCKGLPGIEHYRRKMASVLEIELVHTEGLSILKYGEGGFYKRHHDYIMPTQKPHCHENAGPRVLTFLAYLTDVEQGGATRFFHLDLDVMPRAGRVLLFTDTLSRDPLAKDERTAHEALVVERGEKIVATTWVRQHEAAKNMYNGCCEG